MSRTRTAQVAARGVGAIGRRLVGLSELLQPHARSGAPTLSGDRDVEWSWCAARLPTKPGRVLDFGAGSGILSLAASFRGHRVVAADLEPCSFQFAAGSIEFVQGDFNELTFEPASFDHVINCSTIEHVGLSGRYAGGRDEPDGDLRAMERLAALLKPTGDMALTLPVGLDALFAPLHRVYGAERLPRLLAPFEIVEEQYWTKSHGPRWERVTQDDALAQAGSPSYYGLGLYVLRRRAT